MAVWQSGHAAACKAVYAGSIPASASTCPGGETGRRKGLKIPRGKPHAGSIPALGTILSLQVSYVFNLSLSGFRITSLVAYQDKLLIDHELI